MLIKSTGPGFLYNYQRGQQEFLESRVTDRLTLLENTKHMPLSERAYTFYGTSMLMESPIFSMDDALHKHAAIDGHEQSGTERGLKAASAVLDVWGGPHILDHGWPFLR